LSAVGLAGSPLVGRLQRRRMNRPYIAAIIIAIIAIIDWRGS
jgi:hypothetical protein